MRMMKGSDDKQSKQIKQMTIKILTKMNIKQKKLIKMENQS